MKSSAAISLFERPCAASTATRCSVSVSQFGADRRPAIRLVSARALPAHSRAPALLEDRERLVERLAGRPALLRLPPDDAEGQQGAGSLEWELQAVKVAQGLVEGSESGGEVALGGGDQTPAPGAHRGGPWTPDGLRPLLVPLDVDAGAVDLAEQHERLEARRPTAAAPGR